LSSQTNCPFCSIDAAHIVFADELIFAFWDGYPVSEGHLLIVPRRHVADWSDLEDHERAAITAAIDRAIVTIRSRHDVEGFNVGFNNGAAAGQTVFHFHLHVIPRRTGDVTDPRGGVRHVIPTKANYLADRETSLPSETSSPLNTAKSTTTDLQRLVTGGDDPLLPHLVTHMDRADRCEIAVAFLLDSGARLILKHLEDLLARGGSARILVGDYLDVTDPVALRRLADLDRDLVLRAYQSGSGLGFHLKSYTFLSGAEGVSFVGSSNISESALTTSIEWNYKVISSHDVGGFGQIRRAFDHLFNAPATTIATPAWIDAYERRRVTEPIRIPDVTGADVEYEPPQPKLFSVRMGCSTGN
jgi:HKD family nuclease/diadenosine tetraphosphate (Ap4A) HIT family hydrolase